ncbi:MAG: hypothetical protein ABI456_12805 [Ktedonobacteraceae bacterium]|nr:hypothetical protein [Chloroflexota bacterium]
MIDEGQDAANYQRGFYRTLQCIAFQAVTGKQSQVRRPLTAGGWRSVHR